MNTTFKQQLKARAHHLKPVILIGSKGLTEGVMNEIDLTLKTHELIKIKINGQEKEDRLAMFASICDNQKAECVQLVGHTATIYRKNEEK